MTRLGLTLLSIIWTGFITTAGLAGDKPNIILIVSDDAGFSDIGAFGSEIETPNLDRLSYEGLRLSQFYSNSRCSPTRASLLTGQYPQSVGVGDLANAGLRTDLSSYLGYLNPQGNETLAEILKANGYHTIMSGKWHLGGYSKLGKSLRTQTSPIGRGFDQFFGLLHGQTSYTDTKRYSINDQGYRPSSEKPFYATDAFVDYAIESIANLQETSSTAPFFLYLPFTAPHVPLEAPQNLIEKYQSVYSSDDPGAMWQRLRRERYDRAVDEGVIAPSTPFRDDSVPDDKLAKIMRELPVHAAMMDRLDQNIGFLLNYLEDINELENSVIIYMSDNGGRGAYHLIGNSPFYGRKADLWEGGVRTHFVLWSPKYVDTPGRVVQAPIHAIDVVPTVLDLLQISGNTKLDGESFAAALSETRWANNRTLFWDLYGAQAVRKTNWKYLSDRYGTEYLFDLDRDPTETENLIGAFPDLASELKDLHKDWAATHGVLPHEIVEEAQKRYNEQD